VPSSQALLGFLITAPPSVLNPAVLGALAVWIQNPNKKKENSARLHSNSRNTPLQHVPHPATHLVWSPLCPPYQGELTRTNLNAPFFFFPFSQFSLEVKSPQLLCTEDTDLPGARSKRRGYSPRATARHSQPAGTHTDKNRQKTRFCPISLG